MVCGPCDEVDEEAVPFPRVSAAIQERGAVVGDISIRGRRGDVGGAD